MTNTPTLEEVLRAYPGGGLSGLSRATGIPYPSLYRFATKVLLKTPWRYLRAVLTAHLALSMKWHGAPEKTSAGWEALWLQKEDRNP